MVSHVKAPIRRDGEVRRPRTLELVPLAEVVLFQVQHEVHVGLGKFLCNLLQFRGFEIIFEWWTYLLRLASLSSLWQSQ